MKTNSITNKDKILYKVLPTLLSMFFSMSFFSSNAYAFSVACPSGFALNVVCSCQNGDLLATSGGSSTNVGPNALCAVDATGVRQQLGLQNAIISAADRGLISQQTFDAVFEDSFQRRFGDSESERQGSTYKSSDLPEWDFSADVQSSVGSSEISLTSAPDRKSDFHSVAISLGARKDALAINGQFRYRSINGRGVNNGQDTMHYGFLLSPSFLILNQAEQGVNLAVHSFIDISGNDNKNTDDQTRFATGAGFSINRATSLGLFNLGYTFTHDRNLNNDNELTGDQYFSIHQVNFNHSIHLLDSLLFTTRLSHMHIPGLPDAIEDNGSKAGFSFSYAGFKNIVLKAGYDKSFDGYGHESGNFSAAYNW